MNTAAVFIDGGYLHNVLKHVFKEPTIDYAKFCDALCTNVDAKRFRTYYYDCMPYQSAPPTPTERTQYAGKQRFFRYLQFCPRFDVRFGKMQKVGTTPPKQKRIDVLLSVEMVRMSWDHQIETAILVSGDSDLVPAVKATKDAGVITVVYHSRYSPRVYAHDELLLACDERIEITQALIDSVKR